MIDNSELKLNLDGLSLRSIGLLNIYERAGEVLPAAIVKGLVKEGRDAIRSAMNELEKAGLIKVNKFQVNGKWRTEGYLVKNPTTGFQSSVNQALCT